MLRVLLKLHANKLNTRRVKGEETVGSVLKRVREKLKKGTWNQKTWSERIAV